MASGYVVASNNDFSGGLNLRDKSDVVKASEAIDCLNVDFTDVGAIKQRDGYIEFTSSELTNRIDSLSVYYTASGTSQLLAGCGTRLEAINTAGAVVASATGLTGGPYTFARFAAPGSELALAANGSDTLRQWNGSAWSAPTGTVNGTGSSALPKAGSVCVTPNTNRLVATAYGTGTTSGPGGGASSSNPSRVHFSNIGDPFTWETDGTLPRGRNYVDLTPGDGEQIMAAITWRDKVFVFKETKFFVFEGEGVNNDATPIFRYRAVDTGIGLAGRLALTASRNGVYFMDQTGLYFTNGGDPAFLSDKVDPFWIGNADVYFQSSTLNQSQIALVRIAFHDERIYVAAPTGVLARNDRVLVYDIQQRWWSLYDLPASAFVSWERLDLNELHFGYSTGTKDSGRIFIGSTTDNGATITSRWRSGWFDLGADVEKTIRQSRLWGTGSILYALSRDFDVSAPVVDQLDFTATGDTWGDGTNSADTWGDGTNPADTWGGGGQVIDKMSRSALRGTVFSMAFSNSTHDATWTVHRTARHIREQRPAGITT